MGRPTKLTPEVTKTITDAIAIGATYQAAAEYAGVGYSTFLAWMVKKAKLYREFQEAVEKANAKARISLLAAIQKPAQAGDWRAAAWILERRFADEYSQKVKQEHSGDQDKPIRIVAQSVDYRAAVAPLAPRPVGYLPASGEDQGSEHGAEMGENGAG